MSEPEARMSETRRIETSGREGPDPSAWFETLYAAADDGTAVVPWDHHAPNDLLASWLDAAGGGGDGDGDVGGDAVGNGRRALVVGCGLGDDAELLAARGFATVAFDVSETAIAMARRRYPDSPVEHVVLSLFELPDTWREAFDVVFECRTVQSLPESVRAEAVAAVASTVTVGGQLLVVAAAREDGVQVDGPPWPLSPSDIDLFAASGLAPVDVRLLVGDSDPGGNGRWRALFARPPG